MKCHVHQSIQIIPATIGTYWYQDPGSQAHRSSRGPVFGPGSGWVMSFFLLGTFT